MSGKLIVNVKQIKQNITNIKKKIGAAKFCAVVKANCYGFGIEFCKHIETDVDCWAVATIVEAQELSNITQKDILVLTPPDINEIKAYHNSNRTNIVYAVDSLKTVVYLIRHKIHCKIHIAVNTGMNRHGTDYVTFKKMLQLLGNQSHVKLAGVFSHFYKNTNQVMQRQYWEFEPFIKLAKSFDKNIICHISNSHGLQYSLDMVRVGIGLYDVEKTTCFSVESYIKNIRSIDAGQCVSYGANFVASRPTKVAVIPLGYADGINRKLSGAHVIICGKKCPIIGDICMDCFMVDVSACKKVKVGTQVIMVGKMQKESINICQLAQKCDTISYELLTRLGSRIQRIYKE